MTVDKPATRLGAMHDSDLLCGPRRMNLRRRGRQARAVSYNYALNCFYCEDLNDEEGAEEGGEGEGKGAVISDEVA